MLNPQSKFLLAGLIVAPIMPLVFYQGNKIRKKFPRLPEAVEPRGSSGQFSKEITVVGLGESTMAGVGIDQHINGFIGQFSQHLSRLIQKKINWSVYAKSGLTAEHTRKQLLPKVLEKRVDLFVVSLGGNDTFQLNSPKKWTREVDHLIKAIQLQFPKTPILFTTMPPIHTFPAFTGSIRFVLGGLVRLHSQALVKLLETKEETYYDARKIELKEWLTKMPGSKKEEFYSDGVHPSELTFAIWGREMAELIYKNHYQRLEIITYS